LEQELIKVQNPFDKPFPIFDLENGYILSYIDPVHDAKDYFTYMNHPDVSVFIPLNNLPLSPQQAETELKYWRNLFLQRKSFYWAIRYCQTGQISGTIGFNNISFMHLKAEISYDLSYFHQNKGIMTKALSKVVTFGFDELRLVRIQASAAKDNLKSQKLLVKTGFKEEGVMSKFELLHGVHTDFVLYALIK